MLVEAQRGVYSDGGGPISVRNNAIQCSGTGYGIEADNPNLVVTYCALYGVSGPTTGAFPPPQNCYTGAFTLGPEYSAAYPPLLDGGPPEAIYNDRDGTRNDIGYTGGPYWNPANYTNSSPMVFFLTGSPQTVFKGAQTNIQVNVGASAGH